MTATASPLYFTLDIDTGVHRMPKFTLADPAIIIRAEHLIRENFPLIAKAGVKIKYLSVYAKEGNPDGPPAAPPLKKDGRPVIAMIELNKPKHVAQGLPDATVLIDQDRWDEYAEAADEFKAANGGHSAGKMLELLYDSILYSLLWSIVIEVDDETPLFDEASIAIGDNGRPIIKVRRPDFRIDGFHAVIEKYGESCMEMRGLASAFGLYRSILDNMGVDPFNVHRKDAEPSQVEGKS